MLFAAEKTKLTARIAELETYATDLAEQAATISAERDAFAARITELEQALATESAALESLVAEARTAAAAEIEETVAGRIDNAVTDALASAGIPSEDLPARGEGTAQSATLEDLREQLESESDPVKAGAIVAQIKSLKGKSN